MFDKCQWCQVQGERVRNLPFGIEDGKMLVILRPGKPEQEALVDFFGDDAYFVHQRTCEGVEVELGDLGCGIMIRQLIPRYKTVVCPSELAEKFFGAVPSVLSEYKSGQLILTYDEVMGQRTAAELKRIAKNGR